LLINPPRTKTGLTNQLVNSCTLIDAPALRKDATQECESGT
jgi:hypothetical protein